MISKFEHVRATAMELAKQENAALACAILDHYWTRATTLADYELLGAVALHINHTEMAVNAAEAVLGFSRTPEELYVARINLNKAYYRANQPEKALFYNKLNLEMRPDDFDSIVSYAAALKLNNQRAESEQVIDSLLESNIPTPKQREELRITSTHPLLRQGQTAEGIKWFLHSDKDRTSVFDIKGMRLWDGIPRPGKTLYVNAGGGIGDEFINIRFFDHLKDLGMTPKLFSILDRRDLAKIFRRHGHEVIVDENELDKTQPWTYLMTLPIDLNITERKLWRGPYLTALLQEKNQLASKTKFRIGIKCDGSAGFEQNTYRSISPHEMLGVLPGDAEVYYFDVDKTLPGVINLKDRIHSWDDTLDFLAQMDIVLSSCTSIIHAAGALGVPSIVCVPILEYYIWTSTRQDESTPWYGTNMWVLKQKEVRDWRTVLTRAGEIIREQKEKQYCMRNEQ